MATSQRAAASHWIIQTFNCVSAIIFLSKYDERICRNLQTIQQWRHGSNIKNSIFPDNHRMIYAGVNVFERSKMIFTWMMLAVRKYYLWLVCLLGMNKDVWDKVDNKWNTFQHWLLFKFKLPTIWSNAFDFSELGIYFVWFICENSSWLLRGYWGNSVIVHWQWSSP